MTASSPLVLVTGGTGFVGSTIVEELLNKHPEWRVTVLDIHPPLKQVKKGYNVDYIEADVRKLDETVNAVQKVKPDLIIHSAGVVPKGIRRYNQIDRAPVFKLNVDGTKHVLEAAKAAGVGLFVFTSSCTVITDDLDHDYPNFDESIPFPKSSLLYGESKAVAEQHVLAANSPALKTCALRPSVILGREDYQLMTSIQACIAKGETPFVIGAGDNLYDFTFVENVADAHVLAAENLLGPQTAAGHALLISNGQPVTFRDFMLAVWAAFGHAPPFQVTVPGWLAWAAGAVAEGVSWVMGTPTTLCRGSVKDALGTRYADISKARRILGFEPRVDLWDGIRISAEAMKKRMSQKGFVEDIS